MWARDPAAYWAVGALNYFVGAGIQSLHTATGLRAGAAGHEPVPNPYARMIMGCTGAAQYLQDRRQETQMTEPAPAAPRQLPGSIQAAPSGSKGFDSDTVLTNATAAAFVADGFRFAVRYLSRDRPETEGNLSATEAAAILNAGLAVMAVQHVSAEGWIPTEDLGQQYGVSAAADARTVGFPRGVNIWLDLEGVGYGSTARQVADYCTAWFAAVSDAGYAPGLYVGARCGLTGEELYDLPFTYYWQSGSAVPALPARGYCMVQSISGDYEIAGVSYDLDTTQTDDGGAGHTPVWLAPAAPVA